jgi:hypothetical protein
MSKDEVIYMDEDLPEIDYLEIISMDEIMKHNPSFIAFSRDEIYNELFNFVKTKTNTENFLQLFYEIVNNKTNVNNFIVVADETSRGNYEESSIEDFISELKKYDKLQPALALTSKNKIWFPLEYDANNTKIRFTAQQKTIIELSKDNNFIVFKDDNTNLPVMGVYFYSPKVIDDDYLTDKIVSHLYKSPEKFDIKTSDNYKDFDELIKDYKIPLPIDKIDIDNYNYVTIHNLLQKYNYNFDNISSDNLTIIKKHLDNLNKNEKTEKISYKSIQIKGIELHNPRFTFFNVLKEIKKLVDITLNSVDDINKQIDIIRDEKLAATPTNITKDLVSIIDNINNENYDEVINNLTNLRKNISIDNALYSLNQFTKNNKKKIIIQLDELETKFELLKYAFVDIYKIRFSFKSDEHELEIGNDESKYEGVPNKIIGNFTNEDYGNDDGFNDNDGMDDLRLKDENEFNKYYDNYYYKQETGFLELLKIVLPFLLKVQAIGKLPINYDNIVEILFNKYRIYDSKYTILKKYNPDMDDADINDINKKSWKSILLNPNENKKVIEAIQEYFNNFMNVIYKLIAYWIINIQKSIIDNDFVFNYNNCSQECSHLWDNYGSPYDIKAKNGVLYYLLCVFKEVYDIEYKDEYGNIIPEDTDYREIILNIIKTDFIDDITIMQKNKIKPDKINKGREYYDTLKSFLDTRDYKNDKFFKAYIDALIYMPSIKFIKIHKYLQGCCLEKIDENFSADLYLRTERKDLKKAKDKLMGKRVFNESRYKRFYISKKQEKKEIYNFLPISNYITYPIINSTINKWLMDIKPNVIFTKELLDQLVQSVYKVGENYKDLYISYFNSKDLKLLFNKHNYYFDNYKQIGIYISKLLFKHLNKDANDFITIIRNAMDELDKLNSIITDDNYEDIVLIRRIVVIRIMSLPSSIESVMNKQFKPIIDITKELHQTILKDITVSIVGMLKNTQMLDSKEQIDFINIIREKNKFDILAKMNKKTREEKDTEKELKKYGLKFKDDDDIMDDNIKPDVNKERGDDDEEIEGEEEYEIDEEDGGEGDDIYMNRQEYGFFYT